LEEIKKNINSSARPSSANALLHDTDAYSPAASCRGPTHSREKERAVTEGPIGGLVEVQEALVEVWPALVEARVPRVMEWRMSRAAAATNSEV
jgi:hypothetical protein